jgi:hypothetical protein
VPGHAKGKLCGPLKQIAFLLVVPRDAIGPKGKPASVNLLLAQKIAQAEAIEARVVASSFISDNPQPKLVSRVNHIEHAQKGSVDASPI